MSVKQRRLLLLITFLWGIAIGFLPIRTDIVTGYYQGDSPATHKFIPAHEFHNSAIFLGFNGHPAGIAGLLLFALMPFIIVWESFSIQRPYSYLGNALLKLQALLLFLGAPYCYYIATYQHGYFYDTQHTTDLAWGGWILFVQDILLGIYVFTALALPKNKFTTIFSKQN